MTASQDEYATNCRPTTPKIVLLKTGSNVDGAPHVMRTTSRDEGGTSKSVTNERKNKLEVSHTGTLTH